MWVLTNQETDKLARVSSNLIEDIKNGKDERDAVDELTLEYGDVWASAIYLLTLKGMLEIEAKLTGKNNNNNQEKIITIIRKK